jgi:hypothetical protein
LHETYWTNISEALARITGQIEYHVTRARYTTRTISSIINSILVGICIDSAVFALEFFWKIVYSAF